MFHVEIFEGRITVVNPVKFTASLNKGTSCNFCLVQIKISQFHHSGKVTQEFIVNVGQSCLIIHVPKVRYSMLANFYSENYFMKLEWTGKHASS